jgi:hypothetical protein
VDPWTGSRVRARARRACQLGGLVVPFVHARPRRVQDGACGAVSELGEKGEDEEGRERPTSGSHLPVKEGKRDEAWVSWAAQVKGLMG